MKRQTIIDYFDVIICIIAVSFITAVFSLVQLLFLFVLVKNLLRKRNNTSSHLES